MPLGADDVQTTRGQHGIVSQLPGGLGRLAARVIDDLALGGQVCQLDLEVATQLDVGATTGHVGGNGHGSRLTGLRDDVCLALMLLGVEHFVGDALLLEQACQELGGLDRGGADEHRLATCGAVLDVLDDGLVLVLLRQVDEVLLVLADHGPVRGDDHHFQTVDLQELRRLGIGRAGHARELLVEAEEILEGDRGDRLVFLADVDAFLGLDGLVQAIRPAAARHRAAGELIDDDDLAVAHDVLAVAVVQRMGAQGRIEVVHEADVGRVIQALALTQQAELGHQLLDVLMAVFGDVDLLALLIDAVVALAFFLQLADQLGHDLHDAQVEVGVLFGGAGDDQRGARLVDEDGVDLVDDRVGQRPLHAVFQAEGQVVAQVVEAEFIVGAVGDVAAIGGALFLGALRVLDDADRQAQEAVQRGHPVRVALRQVLVDRDHVHALTHQRIEVGRQRAHQGLALAGAHLGDLALVQRHAADQLHIEVAHLHDTTGRLAHDREGLGNEVVEGRASLQALAELDGLGAQRLVREGLDLRLELIRGAREAPITPHDAFIAATEDTRQKLEHGNSLLDRSEVKAVQPRT